MPLSLGMTRVEAMPHLLKLNGTEATPPLLRLISTETMSCLRLTGTEVTSTSHSFDCQTQRPHLLPRD